MDWLSQNWTWLALAAFVFLMMRRGSAAGGCCGSMHVAPDQAPAPAPGAPRDDAAPPARQAAGATHACCGGGHGAQRPAPAAEAQAQQPAARP